MPLTSSCKPPPKSPTSTSSYDPTNHSKKFHSTSKYFLFNILYNFVTYTNPLRPLHHYEPPYFHTNPSREQRRRPTSPSIIRGLDGPSGIRVPPRSAARGGRSCRRLLHNQHATSFAGRKLGFLREHPASKSP